jgi:hypothetical protein
LFQRYEVVTNAAREGARIAVLPDYDANVTANVQARVTQYLTAAGLTGTTNTVVGAKQSVSIGTQCMFVRPVTVTYDSDLILLGPVFGLFGGGTFRTITATSSMRLEMAAESCGP